MLTKRLICLANSRKLQGRSIAGRVWLDTRPGPWIRPVSARAGQEVSEYERQYEDGSDPKLLDVIDVPFLEPRPKDYQTENWLFDSRYYWKRVSRFSWFDLPALADPIAPLWTDGHSTHKGLNDRIPLAATATVTNSLRLLHVDCMQLVVCWPGEAFGNNKRRVQGRFMYAGTGYGLWITDPVIERTYLAKLDGTYEIKNCYITVNLGEPYGDSCYKLIAAILRDS